MGKDNLHNVVSYIVAISGSIATYLFGGCTYLIYVLVTFVIMDYISGMLASGIEGKLNSEVGWRGIAKKVSIFLLVAIGHLIDVVLGNTGDIVRDAIIYFYVFNELLSIIENMGRIGLPIPSILEKAIEILKNKSDGALK